MTNFFHTISIFRQDQFTDWRVAAWRHSIWQFRKFLNLFPYDISMGKFMIRIADRNIANGVGAMINALGYYDPNNMYLIEEIFGRGLCKSCFDIGSNIGVYALIVASSRSRASVYAFEPHPETFSLLCENVRLNNLENSIQCLQIALGDRDGQIDFTDMPGSPVNRAVEDTGELVIKTVQVEVHAGDTICQEREAAPDVLKIDVEGFEDKVLLGFKSTLPSVKLVLVECQDVFKTAKILCDGFGFKGPFKVDYKAHRLVTKAYYSYEDWVFLSPAFLPSLSSLGFRLDIDNDSIRKVA